MTTDTAWSPDTWRSRPIRQAPTYPDQAALAAVEARLRRYPPLVFAGEARRLQGRARPAPPRAAPSCCRAATAPKASSDFTANIIRDTFRVLLQMAVVLTFGACAAGGEARPHGRASSPSRAPRDTETRDGVTLPSLSRRHHQRPGVHRRSPHARPGAHGDRLLPVRRHAQPAARLRHRRLCRPARGAPLEPRLRRPLAAGRALPATSRTRIDETLGLHVGLRHHRDHHRADPRDRLLHQPRGAAAALRAGADPRRFHHRRLVRAARRISCGSATAPASRTARMSNSCAACTTRSA